MEVDGGQANGCAPDAFDKTFLSSADPSYDPTAAAEDVLMAGLCARRVASLDDALGQLEHQSGCQVAVTDGLEAVEMEQHASVDVGGCKLCDDTDREFDCGKPMISACACPGGCSMHLFFKRFQQQQTEKMLANRRLAQKEKEEGVVEAQEEVASDLSLIHI